jgi:hypothetical protein
VLATDDDTRGFLTAAGMVADGAHRERVVSPDGATAGELRLSAALADEATDAATHQATHDATDESTHEAIDARDPEGP